MYGLLLPIVGLLLLAGCSTGPRMDYSQVELVDATGTITLDGQPLAGAVVTFDGDDGTFSYGLTDSAGHYTLQFDSVKQGVKTGKKTVRISTTRKILGLNSDDEAGGGEGQKAKAPAAVERVPAKYNKNSELTVEVTPDRTEYDFDLKSA
jgi:hypothetical protein